MRWYWKLCLNTTLVASNLLFFAGAIWLLTAGARIRRDGWLDVFEDDYPWFHTVYVLVVIALSVLIATLAISGLYSVLFRRKEWVMLIYAASALLTFTLCLFLTIEGGISYSTAHSWKSRLVTDPAIEGNVQANFNEVYCLAQASYLCTASSNAQWLVHFGSDDMRDLYLSPDVSYTIKQAMSTERNQGAGRTLLQLCEDESSVLHIPTMNRQVANLCTWCGDIADLRSYVHLTSWANSKCPPQKASAEYCIQDVWLNYTIARGDGASAIIENPTRVFQPIDQDVVASAGAMPYVQCRKTFLSYWSYLSLWFLVISAALLLFMVLVIRLAWAALRPKRERYNAWQGKKPERKPLVQMTAKPKAGTPLSVLSPAAATGTASAKPNIFQAAVAKAKTKTKK